jgi:aspartate/methionine/tyrosine aminotransferase
LDARSDLFSYTPPDAGAICTVRYDAPVGSGTLAERLRLEKDVLVVPGDHFGMDRCLRIGFGPPQQLLVEGLDRVAEMFEEILSSTAQGITSA